MILSRANLSICEASIEEGANIQEEYKGLAGVRITGDGVTVASDTKVILKCTSLPGNAALENAIVVSKETCSLCLASAHQTGYVQLDPVNELPAFPETTDHALEFHMDRIIFGNSNNLRTSIKTLHTMMCALYSASDDGDQTIELTVAPEGLAARMVMENGQVVTAMCRDKSYSV